MKRPSFKMPVPFLTKLFVVVFVVLVGYTVIAQTILIPRAVSRQYNQQLKPSFTQVRAKFNAVSKSTELAVYNDPYSDVQAGRQGLLATQQLIVETEQSVTNYEQQANILPSSPFAPRSESYKKAEVIRAKAKDVFLQSREVLSGYKRLTAYLLQINASRTVLKNNTAEINGLADLNRLAGQGDIIAKRAAQLGDTIDKMKQLHPPTEFSEYHTALIASFEQSQAGLVQLSRGLNLADDSQINAGAKVLEQAIRKSEDTDAALFTTASINSAVLKETSMLSDKIDSLQPFLEQ